MPCGDCRIESAASRAIRNAVLAYMRRFHVHAYNELDGSGLIRHIFVRTSRNGTSLVCIVATKKELPFSRELVDMLRRACEGVTGILINVNRRRDNVILSDETVLLWGSEFITETLLGYRFRLSVDSFFQVNPAQTERLYAVAASYLGDGVRDLLDLYCGVGSIGICLSEKVRRLTGVEIVARAVQDAEENARENGITDARFSGGGRWDGFQTVGKRRLSARCYCSGSATKRFGYRMHRCNYSYGARKADLYILQSFYSGA